jgi:hypothetical protein
MAGGAKQAAEGYGGLGVWLTPASSAVTNEKTQLMAAQTDLMQAEIPTVSTQLSLAETQQTALEDVIAQLESTSNNLFSKLPS